MSPEQVFLVAAIGGIAGVVGLVLFVGLALVVYAAVARLHEALEDRKTRRLAAREDLATCQAISALPTTSHPTEEQQ
ncbi:MULTISPECIES: hypothetical protein [unclassified Streptomyces]|uniref:hypothetical protein n=1 Tax=unclassified Streptomyces TaxID=2593676 RepID=UPI001CD3CC49|nr:MULTISPECIES: hypothetical protein [unclassified Streptomyces]